MVKKIKRKRKKIRKSKRNKKLPMKLWEKLFIIFSISIIFIIMGIYMHRLVYYYKKSNYIEPESKLVDIITNQMHVVYSGEGLYKNETDDSYYYNGEKVNNYLYYSNRIWRIIGVDSKGIKVITEEPESSLVWGNNTTYDKSYVYKWLNDDVFLKSLSNQDIIVTGSWCNQTVDINEYKCEENIESKVGLLSIDEYIKAGGLNSYLNNKTYFWTINTGENKNAYYIHNEGGINNEVENGNIMYSYGIRPVIYLNRELSYKSGDGTINSPYKIDSNNEYVINKHPIGTYITYQGYTWRILETADKYTKIILEGYIQNENKEPIKLPYNKVISYLNNTFINKLNKDELVKTEYLETEYNSNTSYDYSKIKNKNTNYIGIPKVGDLFINDYPNNWLSTYASISQSLVYTTTKGKSIFADLTSSENYIRPIISIKNDLIISSGDGTSSNPYVVGDNK